MVVDCDRSDQRQAAVLDRQLAGNPTGNMSCAGWAGAEALLVGQNSRLMGAAVTVEREMNPLSTGSVAGLSSRDPLLKRGCRCPRLGFSYGDGHRT